MTFHEELSELTTKGKNFIRTGQISMYSCTLKEMADLFLRSDRTAEQLKFLVLAFYIDLSGFSRAPFIDHSVVEQLLTAIQYKSINIAELERSYFEWIRADMISQHALGLRDCWYLLRLCIEGKTEHAEYILTKI